MVKHILTKEQRSLGYSTAIDDHVIQIIDPEGNRAAIFTHNTTIEEIQSSVNDNIIGRN